MDAAIAFRILATTAMRPFTDNDWHAFLGCESPAPMIGEHSCNGNDFLLVLDGARLELYPMADGEMQTNAAECFLLAAG